MQLGSEVGRGGEGLVLDVVDNHQFVAKLYHKAIDNGKTAKLSLMTSLRTERLLRVSAWPVDTLHDKPGGKLTGFLMPKITGYWPIHSLYGPKSRLKNFPDATWPFLIHAAANLASAFAIVHEHGHIVGDVNHNNVVVSNEAMIRFIDCDSFQITAQGNRFLCDVGVSTHTPPELQGQPLRGIVRTINHEAFSLAVLIFQLLFMGRHPFSGKYLGTGEISLEQAIREFRFAYGANAALRQMEKPPATLPLIAVSPQVAALFERAFSPESVKQGARPSPHDWIKALRDLLQTLRLCHRHSGHHFHNSLPSCPWCYIESKLGILLFNFVLVSGRQQTTTFNLDIVWSQIVVVPSPGPLPPLPAITSLKVEPSSIAIEIRRERRAKWFFSLCLVVAAILSVFGFRLSGCTAFVIIIGAILLAMGIANAGSERAREELEKSLKEAKARWQDVERRWQTESSDAKFVSKLRELERLKAQYQELPNLRLRKLRQLEEERIKKQMHKFLDGHLIRSENIPDIGPGRKATLMSYGIETAADITDAAVSAVHGFGPALTATLIVWRLSIEKQFVFDPSQPADPNDVAAVEKEIVMTRFKIEQELQRAPELLRQIKHEITAKREYFRQVVDDAMKAVAQAEADKKIV